MAMKRKNNSGKNPGRPWVFSEKLAQKICIQIMEGKSLRKIWADEKMPCASTVYNWLNDGQHNEFLEQYARARFRWTYCLMRYWKLPIMTAKI